MRSTLCTDHYKDSTHVEAQQKVVARCFALHSALGIDRHAPNVPALVLSQSLEFVSAHRQNFVSPQGPFTLSWDQCRTQESATVRSPHLRGTRRPATRVFG